MAQQQPQLPQMPPRPFSPAQPTQSPMNYQQQGLTLPPNNQPRHSPIHSPAQTASPYQPPQPLPYQQQQQQQQQFAASPAASPMNSAAASPSYANMALPQQNQQYQTTAQYQGHAQQGQAQGQAQGHAQQNQAQGHTPYQNGITTPGGFTSTPTTPLAPGTPNTQYTGAMLAPIPPQAVHSPATPGVMGPPSKPAERPTKEYEYDATDSLAGTGINIRDEEQALADYYAGSFGQDSKYGFPANPAGGKSSFYGAGLANQPAQPTDAKTQEKLAVMAAERAWNESAHNLASIRSNEVRNPFLTIAILQRKATEICKKHDINLNLDLKTPQQPIGKMKPAEMWPGEPKLTVETRVGPDGALVKTTGAFLPHDAYLVDQLALLSLATKHRVREKLEEGFHVATVRQKTAHGAVPAEWADVAAPISAAANIVASQDSSSRAGGDSAVSPRTNPLKRPLDPTKSTPFSTKDNLSFTIRKNGEADREVEDARLRKRQKRVNPESATSGSRAGSVAPGTPGTIAPEPDKVLTKKELREAKKAAGGGRGGRGGISDTSTATANQTLQHMMGGFGGRKKGKQYSWMTAGASGASTPTRLNTTDLPGTPGATSNKTVQPARLTIEGKQRLGTFREDGDKGKQIQLRDWLTVMEIDGLELKAIQDAYIKLDTADSSTVG